MLRTKGSVIAVFEVPLEGDMNNVSSGSEHGMSRSCRNFDVSDQLHK
jgi:hypothetical protein